MPQGRTRRRLKKAQAEADAAQADAQRWRGLRDAIYELPQAPVPRSHPRNWSFRVKRSIDFIGHARPNHARFWAKVNPYPKPWRRVRFRTEDGVQIVGWYGPRRKDDDPAFAMVVVPGMFSTKDDTAHKRRAIRIWRHWKIPVLVIDMRAFGESTGIATAGWKEALDVHGAARFLKAESGVERIAIIAESMGGAAALNALAHDSRAETDLFTGGALLWSAFVDARDAVDYINTRPPSEHPFALSFDAFTRLLRYRSHGGYEAFRDYLEDAARVNGLEDVEELLDLANPKWKVPMIHQPTLLVHAVDDPVVPVRHARRMDRYARDQPHIQVVVVPWGQHTGFEPMDPWWYWEVMRRFFGEVNGVALPNIQRRAATHKASKAAPAAQAPAADTP